MRPQRRKLTRRRLRRVSAPTATDSAAAGEAAVAAPAVALPSAPVVSAVPEAPRPMRCMCGTIHEIFADDQGQRRQCGTCRRRFEIQLSYDVATGRNDASIHFLTDENVRTGETCVIGSATTTVGAPAVGKKPRLPQTPLGPEPPQEALHKCTCGALLLVQSSHFEKRVRCPDCGARMVAFLLFDPAANGFILQTFSVVDQSSGSTQVLSKL